MFTITTKHTPPNSFSLLLLQSLNFNHVIFTCKYVKTNPIQHIRVIIFDYNIVSNFMYSDVCVRVELTKTVCSSIVFISLSYHFLRSLCTYPAAFLVFAVYFLSLSTEKCVPPFCFFVCVCVCNCHQVKKIIPFDKTILYTYIYIGVIIIIDSLMIHSNSPTKIVHCTAKHFAFKTKHQLI